MKNEVTETTEEKALVNGTIDQIAIDKVQAEFEELKAENKKKVYGVEVKTEETKELILNFLDNEVEWKYMEAFGIPKIYEAVSKEPVKNGNIYLRGLEVEALAFHLSKANGVGRKSAENFLKMQAAIDPAYALRAGDNRKENQLLQTVEALKQGINVSGAPEAPLTEVIEEINPED